MQRQARRARSRYAWPSASIFTGTTSQREHRSTSSRFPDWPSLVVTRAQTHLQMMRSALADVEDGQEQYRVVRGVFDIAVYGRSVTLALQKFRHWDEAGLDAWYAPWSLK